MTSGFFAVDPGLEIQFARCNNMKLQKNPALSGSPQTACGNLYERQTKDGRASFMVCAIARHGDTVEPHVCQRQTWATTE